MTRIIHDKVAIHQGSERPLINTKDELFLVYDDEMELHLCQFECDHSDPADDGHFVYWTGPTEENESGGWEVVESPTFWWRPFSYRHIESLFALTKEGE